MDNPDFIQYAFDNNEIAFLENNVVGRHYGTLTSKSMLSLFRQAVAADLLPASAGHHDLDFDDELDDLEPVALLEHLSGQFEGNWHESVDPRERIPVVAWPVRAKTMRELCECSSSGSCDFPAQTILRHTCAYIRFLNEDTCFEACFRYGSDFGNEWRDARDRFIQLLTAAGVSCFSLSVEEGCGIRAVPL